MLESGKQRGLCYIYERHLKRGVIEARCTVLISQIVYSCPCLKVKPMMDIHIHSVVEAHPASASEPRSRINPFKPSSCLATVIRKKTLCLCYRLLDG